MIETLRKNVPLIIGIIALATSVMAGMKYIAPASRLAMVELRLDQKIISDRVIYIRDMLWELKYKFNGKDIPIEVRDRIRRLEEDLKTEELKYEIILKKGSQ